MAGKGLQYCVIAKLDESGATDTYEDGRQLREARTYDSQITTNKGRLYGDNHPVEEEVYFESGTLTLELTRLLPENKAFILGNEMVSAGIPGKPEIMERIVSENDDAPHLGVGICIDSAHYGATKYRAIFLKRVQFHEPNDNGQTREDGGPQYQTPTIEGDISAPRVGKYKAEVFVDTIEDAKAWLNAKAAIGVPADKTALNAAISTATGLDSEDYTSASWVAFANALGNAQAVAADAGAVQSQVDAATLALTTAQGNLVERS